MKLGGALKAKSNSARLPTSLPLPSHAADGGLGRFSLGFLKLSKINCCDCDRKRVAGARPPPPLLLLLPSPSPFPIVAKGQRVVNAATVCSVETRG